MAGDGETLPVSETFFLPEEGPDDPRPIVARLVQDFEEFNHLRIGDAVVMVVFRAEEKRRGDKIILGTMGLPVFQGATGAFARWLLAVACGGSLPDFILTIYAEWWEQASPREREALIHHELLHAGHARDKDGEPKFTDEGLPVWGIEPHDLEEFGLTVTRYGAWKSDIADFIEAARRGGAA